MQNRIEEFTRALTMLPGLCGHETPVRKYIEQEFAACGLAYTVDRFGNCLAKIEGTDPTAPVMMIVAHMDSLGFMVKYVDEDGFLKLERVGGIPEKVLPNTELVVGTKDGRYLDAVIGMKAHHQTSAEEKYIVDRYQSLFVDIGAHSREEVFAQGVEVGSPVVYKPRFTRLLNDTVCASFLDDRGGCAVLLELAHRLPQQRRASTVWLVASTLEEYNLRGAMVAARAIQPDIAIALDGGAPCDTPDLAGTGHIRMGGGPVMDLYNFHGRGTLNGTIAHPGMARLAQSAADALGILLQRQVYVGGLTDMSYVQFEHEGGVMCLDLGFPIRYCHGPCEVSALGDMQQLTELVERMANTVSVDTDFTR